MDRNELKDKFTIYVFTDSSVTEDEREMLMNAMASAARIYGCWFLMEPSGWGVPEGAAGDGRSSGLAGANGNASSSGRGGFSADDIIEKAPVNEKGQIGASEILTMMQAGFRSQELKGAMFIFTGRDLYLNKTWCFGAARVGGGVSVQSMARFRGLSDSEKQAVISRTLRHELGHIHRLAADHKRAKVEKKFGWHCTSKGCTMRQSPNLKTLLKHAAEEDPENCLCALCREDLRRFKEKNY